MSRRDAGPGGADGGGRPGPRSGVPASAGPGRIEAGEDDVDAGVARLVLTLVDLIRRILEKEAVRRMEAGTLTDEEVERLGLSLMRLEERMDDLKEIFGLTDRDLELDLGPLSRLL